MKTRTPISVKLYSLLSCFLITACGSSGGMDGFSSENTGDVANGIFSESGTTAEPDPSNGLTLEDCLNGTAAVEGICSSLVHDAMSERAASRTDTELNNHLIFVDDSGASGDAIAPPSVALSKTQSVLATLTPRESLRFHRVMRVVDSVEDSETTPFTPEESDLTGGVFGENHSPDDDVREAASIDDEEYIQDCQHYSYWRFYDYFQFILRKNQVSYDPTAIGELAFGESDAALGERLASGDELEAFGGDIFNMDQVTTAFKNRTKKSAADDDFSDYAKKRAVRNEFYLLNNAELEMLQGANTRLWRAVRINTSARRQNRSFININNRGWKKHRRFYRALRDEPVEEQTHFYHQRKAFVELLEERREIWKSLKSYVDSRGLAEGCAEDRATAAAIPDFFCPASVPLCDAIDNVDHELIVALEAAHENGCIGHTSKAATTCDWAIQDFVDDVTETWAPKVEKQEARCNDMDHDVSVMAHHAHWAVLTAPAIYPGALELTQKCTSGTIERTRLPGSDCIEPVSSVRGLNGFIRKDEKRREDVIECLANSANPPRPEYETASDDKWGSKKKFRVCLDRNFQTKLSNKADFGDVGNWDDLLPTVSGEFDLYATWKRSSCSTSSGKGKRWKIMNISRSLNSNNQGSDTLRYLNGTISPSGNPKNMVVETSIPLPIMGIPLHLDIGVAGKVGIKSSLISVKDNLTKTVKGEVSPYASVDGFAELGIGFSGILDAGIRGDLNLIKASLPTSTEVEATRPDTSAATSEIKVSTRIAQEFKLSSLSGKISAYLETFWKRYSKVFFRWSGVSKTIPIWDKDWEYTLEQLKAADL